MRVLLEPGVTCHREAEDAFDDHERMLDFGRYARLCLVLRPLHLIDLALVAIATVDHILRFRCTVLDDLGLTFFLTRFISVVHCQFRQRGVVFLACELPVGADPRQIRGPRPDRQR